jgi:hypothetical protein
MTGYYFTEKGQMLLKEKDYVCDKYTVTGHLFSDKLIEGMHILRLELHGLDAFESEE